MTLPRLKRVRWAVRLVLALGVAASTTANILHAEPNPISQSIAAWPPLALLLTVELIARVPVHRRSLAIARWVATATIASIAAWVSYWHMAELASRYGEQGASPYLLPISVDGLVVVASVCLVELAGRIRDAETPTVTPAKPASGPAAAAAPVVTPDAPVSSRPRTPRRKAGRKSAADRVATAARRTPAATAATLAGRLGLSERTVQRHLDASSVDKMPTPQPTPERVNGHLPALDGRDEVTV